MVKLRKATLEDFEDFKTLFKDEEGNYEWLLWNFKEDPESRLDVKDVMSEYHEIDEYFDLTTEKLTKLIESKYDFPFIIESNDEVEGIILAAYIARGIYKITCWNFYDTTNINVREESLQLLIKNLPYIKRLDVCSTFPTAITFLENHGFVQKGISHYMILDILKD